MQIDREFIREYEIKTCIFEGAFKSKKNVVYKARCTKNDGNEKEVVVKVYKGWPNSSQKELGMLLALREKGLTVPEVYHAGKNTIIMEYLDGHNLLDIIYWREELAENINNHDCQANRRLIDDLFSWLHDFYKLAKEITGRSIIFGDINLRNFVIANEKLYGLDFEDYCEGQVEKDAGRFCAFVLTYNPAFTDWKWSFVQKTYEVLAKRFGCNELLVEEEMKKELAAIKKRRG